MTKNQVLLHALEIIAQNYDNGLCESSRRILREASDDLREFEENARSVNHQDTERLNFFHTLFSTAYSGVDRDEKFRVLINFVRLTEDEKDFLHGNQKIQAIKSLRNRSGLSLRMAKDVMDYHMTAINSKK